MYPSKSVFVEFKEVSGKLITLLKPLSAAALNYQPMADSWSAGQIGDHLLKSYAVVNVLKGTTQSCSRKPDAKVWDIKKLFLDFTIRMESPVEILPSTDPISKTDLLAELNRSISEFYHLQDTDLGKVCTDFAIPAYGPFTRLEWMWFTVFHTYRHVYQLEKVVSKIPQSRLHQVQ